MSQKQQTFEKRSPRAIFLQNVEQACKGGCDEILSQLDQQYNRYRLTEGQLLRSQQTMAAKIPEIEKTILMIESLSAAPNAEIDFLVSEGVYVKGKAKGALKHVSLWLGAGTVVELTFQEAKHMLSQNLDNAKKSFKDINDELFYIKDQKTTTQVNVARVYNHSLTLKREEQLRIAREE